MFSGPDLKYCVVPPTPPHLGTWNPKENWNCSMVLFEMCGFSSSHSLKQYSCPYYWAPLITGIKVCVLLRLQRYPCLSAFSASPQTSCACPPPCFRSRCSCRGEMNSLLPLSLQLLSYREISRCHHLLPTTTSFALAEILLPLQAAECICACLETQDPGLAPGCELKHARNIWLNFFFMTWVSLNDHLCRSVSGTWASPCASSSTLALSPFIWSCFRAERVFHFLGLWMDGIAARTPLKDRAILYIQIEHIQLGHC